MSSTENPYESPQVAHSDLNTRPRRFNYGLNGAAIGLLIVSTFELIATLIAIPALLVGIATLPSSQTLGGTSSPDGVMSIIAAIVCFLRAAANIAGAICMRLRKNYSLALTAAIMSCLGFAFMPLWFGVPFGIWALIALLPAETRAAFAKVS